MSFSFLPEQRPRCAALSNSTTHRCTFEPLARIIVRHYPTRQNSLWCGGKKARGRDTSMHDFQLKLSDLTFTGSGLDRPECVLATAAGDLFTSDARGGVVHIRPDGAQQLIVGQIPGGGKLHPNGFAMLR